MLKSTLTEQMSFEKIRYSTVWEDPQLLESGLKVTPDDNILSIASAGCNVLHLLNLNPRSITAIDLSRAQIALVHLKLMALKKLSTADFKELIGLNPNSSPVKIYEKIRRDLPEEMTDYWDNHQEEIAEGLIHSGRLEKYFKKFREQVLPHIWSPEIINQLLEASSVREQWAVIEKTDMKLFRKVASQFFGREDLSKHGRDPAQFKYVEEQDVGSKFFNKFELILKRTLISQNYFLRFFLTGTYPEGAYAPCYLKDEQYKKLRTLTGKVTLITQDLETFLENHEPDFFSKANLSDIFEYLSENHTQRLFGLLKKKMKKSSRVAYWNLLVDRLPNFSSDKNIQQTAVTLSSQDRVWFYKQFNLIETT